MPFARIAWALFNPACASLCVVAIVATFRRRWVRAMVCSGGGTVTGLVGVFGTTFVVLESVVLRVGKFGDPTPQQLLEFKRMFFLHELWGLPHLVVPVCVVVLLVAVVGHVRQRVRQRRTESG
jgi:hypothetical protein